MLPFETLSIDELVKTTKALKKPVVGTSKTSETPTIFLNIVYSSLGSGAQAPMATVIIGAGIIGTSTAYYLSESSTSPSDIHLIESSPELFASASGYAAGFLARDWFSPSLSALGALSFDLHKELAEANNGAKKWGYSRSTAYSLEETVGETGEDWLSDGTSRVRAANKSALGNGHGPPWLTDNGKLEVISTGDTTAQVYVRMLCMISDPCPMQSISEFSMVFLVP